MGSAGSAVAPESPDLSRFTLAEPQPPAGSRRDLGQAGEDLAADVLAARGFRILERGYRTRMGEIDLIAAKDGLLVFIEVKTRSSLACGRPSEAVDARKQARILRAASFYLERRGAAGSPCRFDVVEILKSADGTYRLHHIPAAFEAD